MLVFCMQAWIMAGCGKAEEPDYGLVNLQHGSPGYGADREVRSLINGMYLVKHEKTEIVQEKDKDGNLFKRHLEDWYAVKADADGNGSIVKIASSLNDIPGTINGIDRLLKSDEFDFDLDPVMNPKGKNIIKGLTNNETYGVYFYGELNTDKMRVGRRTGELSTWNYNAIANIKNLAIGDRIYLWESELNSGNETSGLCDNNCLVVLVNTPLEFTDYNLEMEGGEGEGANIIVKGRDFNIEVKNRYNSSWASVAPIQSDGQQYFILTAGRTFRGFITKINK